ncbi:hypothetical protein ES705_10538 [subsurface metagenome]
MRTIEGYLNRNSARTLFRKNLFSKVRNLDKVDVVEFAKVELGCMLCEILDDMLIQKIQSDKVLEGILKDIQSGLASENKPDAGVS